MSSQPDQIPAEVAYQAAQDRALRTVAALITSEALTMALRMRVGELEGQVERLRRAEENHFRPTNEGPAEWVCTHMGEVKHDATSDEVGGAPVRPSYPPVTFSD